jgi:hypothetical protein
MSVSRWCGVWLRAGPHVPCRKNRNRHCRELIQLDEQTTGDTPISTPSQRIKMSLAASRAVLRQSTFAVRRAGVRNASTTAEATNTVKDTASKVQSKASEGLTKVTSSANAAAAGAGQAVSNTTQAATGRIGRMVNFFSGQSHSWWRRGLRAIGIRNTGRPKRAGREERVAHGRV